MKYRYLGNSGLKISEIGLGVMTFGGDLKRSGLAVVDQDEADRMIGKAIDIGINFFDTADVYSGGFSEEVLGKALENRRQDAVIATKVRFAMSAKPNDTGLSRHHVLESCENSLRRLRSDHIDLYQIHSYDPGTPLEETLRVLDSLVKSGKVRYIGCSNLAAWQTMKALALSERLNLEKFVSTQLYYSIGAREIEHELLPLCMDQSLGILCWSPLSGGFFTGKYRRDQSNPAGARRTGKDAAGNKYWPVDEGKGFEIVDKLEMIGEKYGKSISQVALNWLLRKPQVCGVIVGARNGQQLVENAGASDWTLLAEDIAELDNISSIPAPYPIWHQQYSDER